MNMVTIWAVVFGILVFGIQFFLCCRTKKTMIRLIPAMVITALIAACGIVFLVAGNIYGASFAAVVYAVVLAILLAVDALSWFAYCIFRFIQKVR